jgi:Ser/Thr protein kinase RdoA (MazF antagonist)
MDETAKALVANRSLSAPSVRVSNHEALALAKTRFDIEGRVRRFDTEKDDTFRLTSRDGRNYTLKIANAAEDPREVSFQIDLLAHIAAKNPGLPVPRVVPDRDRRLQFSYADSAGQKREVHLLTYLEGVPLSEVTTDACERERIGEVLGTLRLAMAGYSHAADSREIAWDVKHLLKLAPLLGEIADPARREMIEAGLDRFASIADRLAKCRTQVLHNDFSKSNIVVDKSDANFVTGVIDFGDAVRTAVVIDVATALLNQLPSQQSEDFFGAGCDLLRGYLRVADLTEEELSLLPHLVMARVVARALLTIWRARLFPDNAPYIMRNTDQGWRQLAWFMARSMDRISNEFMIAAR